MMEDGIDDRKRAFASFLDVYQTLVVVPDIRIHEFHALLPLIQGHGDLFAILLAKFRGVAVVAAGAGVQRLSRRLAGGSSGICSRRQAYDKGNAAK